MYPDSIFIKICGKIQNIMLLIPGPLFGVISIKEQPTIYKWILLRILTFPVYR